MVIGSGIFRTTPDAAQNVGSPNLLLIAWLVGGIVALANAAAYSLLFGVFTNSVQTGLGFTYVMTTDQKVGVVINAIATSVPFGILVGAFSGFYRRFLAMSSPPRQQAPAKTKRR